MVCVVYVVCVVCVAGLGGTGWSSEEIYLCVKIQLDYFLVLPDGQSVSGQGVNKIYLSTREPLIQPWWLGSLRGRFFIQ